MKTYCITGANGFVGQALLRQCLQAGDRVIAPIRSPCAAIEALAHQYPGQLISRQVSTPTDIVSWAALLDKVDGIFHLAARVHQMKEDHETAASLYRQVNVDFSLDLAQAALSYQVPRFVYLSSIKVYGDEALRHSSLAAPITETREPHPSDPYGISKWQAEQSLCETFSGSDSQVLIIRPPLVYGQGVKANFAKLMGWVRSGWPLPFGLAHQHRSMVFVENLADGLRTAMNSKVESNTFNITDPKVHTLRELIEGLGQAMNTRPRLVPVPASVMQRLARFLGKEAYYDRLMGSAVFSADRFYKTFHWQPPFDFADALKQTVLSINRHR